jgi:hypothetical protein
VRLAPGPKGHAEKKSMENQRGCFRCATPGLRAQMYNCSGSSSPGYDDGPSVSFYPLGRAPPHAGPGRWREPKAMTGVAIVIPMPNEAAGLPRLLRSLAAL